MTTSNRSLLLKLLPLVVCATLLLSGGTGADAQGAETFKGKTVFIYIGFAPGGSYDYFGRLLARHLSRHLPGNPTVVAELMPGAGIYRCEFSLYPRAA